MRCRGALPFYTLVVRFLRLPHSGCEVAKRTATPRLRSEVLPCLLPPDQLLRFDVQSVREVVNSSNSSVYVLLSPVL